MTSPVGADRVPARRFDAAGVARVDQRAILVLAMPLIANSAVQLVLSLTDVWFIGRISTQALAAVSAVHWLAIVVLMVLSGVGMAVQTVVAQAHGARRQARAAQAVWIALWALLLSTPLFLAVGLSIRGLLAPFGLPPAIADPRQPERSRQIDDSRWQPEGHKQAADRQPYRQKHGRGQQ